MIFYLSDKIKIHVNLSLLYLNYTTSPILPRPPRRPARNEEPYHAAFLLKRADTENLKNNLAPTPAFLGFGQHILSTRADWPCLLLNISLLNSNNFYSVTSFVTSPLISYFINSKSCFVAKIGRKAAIIFFMASPVIMSLLYHKLKLLQYLGWISCQLYLLSAV